MRWNSPPNWPMPPPGWTPPPGWQPDPAWGPAPPGHTFWVSEQPGQPPGQPSQPPHQPAQPPHQWNQPTARLPAQPYPGALPSGGGQGGGGGRSSMWIVVALVTVLALVIGGVVALVVRGGDEEDDAPASSRTDDPVDEPTESEPTRSAEPTEDEPTDPAQPSESAEPTDVPVGDILPLGESATVGDWVVSIDAVEQDANQLIADTNEFNEPPTGQYVVVDLTAMYRGAGKSDAWLNVQPKFVEPDGAENPSYECIAVLPQPAFNTPSLRRGESTSYQVCFDVPAENIEGGRIVIVDLADFGGEGVAWAVE